MVSNLPRFKNMETTTYFNINANVLLIGIVVYAALLFCCMIVLAFKEKKPDNTQNLELIDYITMILLTPFYIVIEGSKWIYHNYYRIVDWLYDKVVLIFTQLSTFFIFCFEFICTQINYLFTVMKQIKKIISMIGEAVFEVSIKVTLNIATRITTCAKNIIDRYILPIKYIIVYVTEFLTLLCKAIWNVIWSVMCNVFWGVINFLKALLRICVIPIKNAVIYIVDFLTIVSKSIWKVLMHIGEIIYNFVINVVLTVRDFVITLYENFIVPVLTLFNMIITNFNYIAVNICYTIVKVIENVLTEIANYFVYYAIEFARQVNLWVYMIVMVWGPYIWFEFINTLNTVITELNVILTHAILFVTRIVEMAIPVIDKIYTILTFLWSNIYQVIIYPFYYYILYIPCYKWLYEGILYNGYLFTCILYNKFGSALYNIYLILYDKLISFFGIAWEAITDIFTKISTKVYTMLTNGYITGLLSNMFAQIFTQISTLFNEIGTKCSDLYTNVNISFYNMYINVWRIYTRNYYSAGADINKDLPVPN